MTAHYTSKHGQVAKRPEELYMAFTDLRNFAKMVPQGKVNAEITADYDNLTASPGAVYRCAEKPPRR